MGKTKKATKKTARNPTQAESDRAYTEALKKCGFGGFDPDEPPPKYATAPALDGKPAVGDDAEDGAGEGEAT